MTQAEMIRLSLGISLSNPPAMGNVPLSLPSTFFILKLIRGSVCCMHSKTDTLEHQEEDSRLTRPYGDVVKVLNFVAVLLGLNPSPAAS